MPRKDIRLDMRLRNNLILAKMEERGIRSVAELCRQMGVPSQQAHVGALVNMTTSPLLRDDGRQELPWRLIAQRIAKFFGCLPEDIFSERQIQEPLRTNRAEMTLSSVDLPGLLSGMEIRALSPETLSVDSELRVVVGRVLGTLNPREEDILRRRFGFDPYDDTQSLDEIAEHHRLDRSRVQQIEGQALRKLRHPLRACLLRQADPTTPFVSPSLPPRPPESFPDP